MSTSEYLGVSYCEVTGSSEQKERGLGQRLQVNALRWHLKEAGQSQQVTGHCNNGWDSR